MSLCFPSWDFDETIHNLNSIPPSNILMLDYEVAELTWENGQLAVRGMGQPRVFLKPSLKSSTWDKPRAGGGDEELFPHLENCRNTVEVGGDDNENGNGDGDGDGGGGEKTKIGRGSCHVTIDECNKSSRICFTSDSSGLYESIDTEKSISKTNTIFDDYDTNYSGKSQRGARRSKQNQNRKFSVSTKISRAFAVHNKSERKRRDKINQRIKTLQKLVPNSNKSDKASMLDEAIEYLKQLQAQVNMMGTMNMPSMMLPLPMQQQPLQISMMNSLSMGMGIPHSHVMDMNNMARHNMESISPVTPPAAAFMPLPSWDGSGDPSSSSCLSITANENGGMQ